MPLSPTSTGGSSAPSAGLRPPENALYSRWLILPPWLVGTAAALLLFGTSAVALWIFHFKALGVLKNNLRDGLRSGATVLANAVDPAAHSQLTRPEQEKEPAYLEAVSRLEAVRQSLNAGATYRFVYTCIRRGDDIYFVLDPTPDGDADGDGVDDKSHLGDLYPEANPRLRRVFETGIADADEEPVVDTWGSSLSGYAPIRDSSGKVVAVAGVDLELSEFNARINRLRQVALGGTAGVAVLAWLGGILVKNYQQRLRRSVTAVIGAMSQARSGERAKSEFLATVSHELRTPLNGIIGMVELLRETPLNARQREQADTILHSGELLRLIIDDILEWSKLESGSLEVLLTPIHLQTCLGEVDEWFASAARNKGLQLMFTAGDSCPAWFEGDARHLRQVLMHLTGNAIKFTPHGKVTVSVQYSESSAGAGNHLIFTVRDTGIGVPADQQEKIFQPFAQGDSTTTRHYGGTGLGLAISRRLCQVMGGEISVQSTPGRGSEFTFHIRCVPVSPPATASGETGNSPGLEPHPEDSADGKPDVLPEPQDILLISPDRMLLHLAGLVLRRLQKPLEHRPDLAAACEFLASNPCQAILVDSAQIGDWQPGSAAALRQAASGPVRLIDLRAGITPETAGLKAPEGFDIQLSRHLRMEDLEAALSPPPD